MKLANSSINERLESIRYEIHGLHLQCTRDVVTSRPLNSLTDGQSKRFESGFRPVIRVLARDGKICCVYHVPMVVIFSSKDVYMQRNSRGNRE